MYSFTKPVKKPYFKEDTKLWYAWVNNIETQGYLGSMYGEIISLEAEEKYYERHRHKIILYLYWRNQKSYMKYQFNVSRL